MCVWLLYLILMVAVEACEVQYTGAVLELEPYSSWEAGGLAILQENAQLFLEHANFAKQQGADILVFPEYGLTSTNLQGGDVLSLSQVVPCPEDYVVPCQLSYTDDHSKVLGELSCGAAQLQLYLVVDLIEVDHCDTQCLLDCSNTGYRLYNTQVVLDRCGAVVARYRKKHLFLEPEFTAGTEDDSTAIFTTDFGVTFSLQVCFDIMYESPGVANVEAGVRNVAMSTAWVDELPFLTAPQIFRGWSAGLGVNLLVANYHSTSAGMLGSGLFPGSLEQESVYTYDHQGGTVLLVAPLKAVTSSCDSLGTSKPTEKIEYKGMAENSRHMLVEEDMVFIHEDLTQYNHVLLEWQEADTPVTVLLCHNDSLCCSVSYTTPGNITRTGHYMLLAYSGLVVKGSGVYSMFTQVCSVVFCLNDDISSCARIEDEDPPLTSNFLPQKVRGLFKAPHVFPSLLLRNLSLAPESLWSYDSIPLTNYQHESLIHVTGDVGPFLSLTLMGRWYQRDSDAMSTL